MHANFFVTRQSWDTVATQFKLTSTEVLMILYRNERMSKCELFVAVAVTGQNLKKRRSYGGG
jgi:hypothetical protein